MIIRPRLGVQKNRRACKIFNPNRAIYNTWLAEGMKFRLACLSETMGPDWRDIAWLTQKTKDL